MNVLEAMQGMTSRFNPAKARGVTATVLVKATGDGGGDYLVEIKDGVAVLTEGAIDNPNVTVTVTGKDWIDILSGELDPTMAFMGGKLKIAGDLGLMMRFQQIFM